MKIFGNSRKQNDPDATMRLPAVPNSTKPTPRPNTHSYQDYVTTTHATNQKKAPKNVKQPEPPHKKPSLTTKQKIQRAILIILIIVCICLGTAAVWLRTVRPPDITNKPAPQPTITTKTEPEEEIEQGDRIADYFTFIVGAVDEDETRTDALMVVSFDAENKKINILNVPRDTMTTSGRNGASRKINASYGTKGGIETTKSDLKDCIGFTPDYYIIVNFQGIADIVDAIGGVDYEVPFRMYYKDPSQDLDIDFEPGLTHMDGKATVEFLRWRKNNGGVKTGDPNYTGSDEQRIEKQQEFLKYVASQVLNISNASKMPAIARAVAANVKTDFTVGELIWMATQAVDVSSENLNMFTLPGYSAYSYAGTSVEYSFYFPYRSETLDLINEYFNPYTIPITSLRIATGPSSSSGSSSRSTSSRNSSDSEDESTLERKSSRNSSKSDEEEEESTSSSSKNNSKSNTKSNSSRSDDEDDTASESQRETEDTASESTSSEKNNSSTSDSSSESSGSSSSSEKDNSSSSTASTPTENTTTTPSADGGDPES